MPFLVLTRDGFQDLRKRTVLSGASVYVNPQILSVEEVETFKAAGMNLHVLPQAVDPRNDEQVQEAIHLISEQSTERVWLEAPSPRQPSSSGQGGGIALPETSIAERKRFHEHLLDGAGQALAQFRKIRASGKRMLVIPYLGYGNANRISLRGRVLEDEGLDALPREASAWENMIGLYKRLESDQVPGARISARFQGIEQEIVTDNGGYFSLELSLPAPLESAGWHTVELSLLDPLPKDGSPVQASGSVLVPPASAKFGVISDIDDTVLWTNVTNKFNMLRMLARSNAHTRKPFKGVAAFYRALHEGAAGKECNPFFYVSSSPWHLFEPLLDFLRMQDIPVGPLMLKELGLRKLFGPDKHHSHKLQRIENIISMYPQLPFILVGDSGEQDPEIYTEVVRRFPNAVRVIYIRNVNPDPSRVEALDRLIEEVRSTGVQLIVTPDSEFAAAHAAAEALIKPMEMDAIRKDKEIDELPDEQAAEIMGKNTAGKNTTGGTTGSSAESGPGSSGA
ncbi:MAG: App1 family protein [Burkholderiaceae bacterium]